jgi:predicted dehydrogenase
VRKELRVKKTRVGVIGCGYWGPKLARNFAGLEDVELAWVSDFREDRLAHMCRLYPSANATKDHRDVLASDVDAVVIATPVFTHHPLAMEALRAGKHILIEKPLADTVAHAREIADTADRLDRAAMVGHTFQYNPAVDAVRCLIARGELGRVFYVDASRVNLGLLQPDINVMWDLAPHDISILFHLLPSDPYGVSARGGVYIQNDAKLHEVAYLTLYFPGEVIANLRLSWLDPVKIRRITVVGSEKMVVYDDIADDKVILFDKGVDVPPYSDTLEEFQMSYRHGPEKVVPIEWREPLANECRAFVDWIRSGRPACSNARVGVKVVQVLEAAQRSLVNGGAREAVCYE